MTRYLLTLCLCAGWLVLPARQPKAVQIFTADDGISMTKRPAYLSIDHNGLLWFGADNGLVSFDGFNFKTYQTPADVVGLPYSSVAYNYQDRLGTYWTMLYKKGLYNYHPQTGAFVPFKVPDSLSSRLRTDTIDTRYPFEDSKNRLWIQICGFGFLRIDEKTKAMRVFEVKDPGKVQYYLSAEWANQVMEHPNGLFYIATNDGIMEMNPETGAYQIFKDNDLPAKECRCILNTLIRGKNDDEIIASSWGNAIKIFNIHTRKFTTYTMGLVDIPCASNVVVDQFRLTDSTLFVIKRDKWETTGFCIFNINTGTFTPIKNIEPRFTWREYNTMIRQGDFLWIPNLSQLYRFYIPALIQYKTLDTATIPASHKRTLQLIADRFWKNGSEQAAVASLELEPWENTFRLRFGCTGATKQDSIVFAYKLTGVDKAWHYDKVPEIQYSGLAPGKYELQVKVHAAPFVFEANTLVMPVVLHGFWWQRWWLKLLLAAGLAGITYWLIRLRINRVQHDAALKAAYEKRLAEVEMKALRAQMNPHFIFNCLNSINKYIVTSDHKTASNYLTRFSKLIRLILDNSASDMIPLQTEMETLELYVQMEAMRFHESFDHEIITAPGLAVETIYIPSMLVQPYVENAIWHGLLHKTNGKGLLQIHVNKTAAGRLKIIITDNGIGRQQAAGLKSKEVLRTKSYGMRISSDRIKLINDLYNIEAAVNIEDLYDVDGNAAGTKVTIRI